MRPQRTFQKKALILERNWNGSEILKQEARLGYALRDLYDGQSVEKNKRHGGFS